MRASLPACQSALPVSHPVCLVCFPACVAFLSPCFPECLIRCLPCLPAFFSACLNVRVSCLPAFPARSSYLPASPVCPPGALAALPASHAYLSCLPVTCLRCVPACLACLSNSYSGSQKFSVFYGTRIFITSVRDLSHINPVHALMLLLEDPFYDYPPSTPRSSKYSLSSSFPTATLYVLLLSHVRSRSS
jgi:hypothetical protein